MDPYNFYWISLLYEGHRFIIFSSSSIYILFYYMLLSTLTKYNFQYNF
jgi:hypothetical protein